MQQLWKMFNKNNWKLKTACLLCWWEFALLLGKLLMHSILVHIWWCLPTKQYAIATFIVKLVDKPLLHHLCSGTCMMVLIIAIHSNHTICACMLILLITKPTKQSMLLLLLLWHLSEISLLHKTQRYHIRYYYSRDSWQPCLLLVGDDVFSMQLMVACTHRINTNTQSILK